MPQPMYGGSEYQRESAGGFVSSNGSRNTVVSLATISTTKGTNAIQPATRNMPQRQGATGDAWVDVSKTTGTSREPNLAGVGAQFRSADMGGCYPMSINELDFVDESGDVGTFPYGTLPDETWGPTSALGYPLGRIAYANAAAGNNGIPTGGTLGRTVYANTATGNNGVPAGGTLERTAYANTAAGNNGVPTGGTLGRIVYANIASGNNGVPTGGTLGNAGPRRNH
ncbi:MAG: hypothetical protein M1840_002051 [Geoglossum simile]|nr:MAG: hypothetical protein M1840_002051 [Geoglossum simile]